MPDKPEQTAKTRLILTSRLADLALVSTWVDDLAREYALPDETVFAINLCLEVALSNVIRHGYNSEPGHNLTVDSSVSENSTLLLTVEDRAPHFPLPEPEELHPATPPVPIEDYKLGGQGLRLMRRFAGSLTWAPLPNGNRLTMGFPLSSPHKSF